MSSREFFETFNFVSHFYKTTISYKTIKPIVDNFDYRNVYEAMRYFKTTPLRLTLGDKIIICRMFGYKTVRDYNKISKIKFDEFEFEVISELIDENNKMIFSDILKRDKWECYHFSTDDVADSL